MDLDALFAEFGVTTKEKKGKGQRKLSYTSELVAEHIVYVLY